jgi:hypothetical protein
LFYEETCPYSRIECRSFSRKKLYMVIIEPSVYLRELPDYRFSRFYCLYP